MGEFACYASRLDARGRIPDPPDIRLRRAYDSPSSDEPAAAKRVLVDRVWPRGVTRERLRADLWARDVAPSDQLRRWFGHEPERWEEFRRRYRDELNQPERLGPLSELLALAESGPLVLLYGAKDEERNQAVVLRDVLLARLNQQNG